MKFMTKTTLIAATAATIVAATAPAMARDRHNGRGNDGIDAGDVIAGALIIGGIAAVASAASNNDRYDDRRYNDRRYDNGRYDNGRYDDRGYNSDYGYYQNGYGSRTAVEQCVQAAQRDAGRYGRARITDVTSINRIRGGYEIKGRLVVAGNRWDRSGRGYNGWDRYGNNYDRYGNDYDKGKFSCVTRYGSVQDLRFSGLRA